MSDDDWLLLTAANQQWGSAALVDQWKQLRDRQYAAAETQPLGSPNVLIAMPAGELVLSGDLVAAKVSPSPPELLFGALVEKGERTDEGHIILAVTPAYRWFLEELARDPNAFYHLDSGQFEELIAGRYEREGCNVVLTKRSRDGGRDVIATRDDFGTIRIIDQVKLYKPHHVVGVEEVRELWGVLNANERGASKGIITTTSRFAAGVEKDFADVIPGRLTLRNGSDLLKWFLPKK